MKTGAFGGVWELGNGRICSFFYIFFDFLSLKGICGATGTLDTPPSRNRVNKRFNPPLLRLVFPACPSTPIHNSHGCTAAAFVSPN